MKLSEKITYKVWLKTNKLLNKKMKSNLKTHVSSILEYELRSIQFRLLDPICNSLKIKNKKL